MKWNFIVKYDIIETEDKERNKRDYKKGNYFELKRIHLLIKKIL